DTRTIVKTPRRCILRQKARAIYIHLGLKVGLLRQLREIHTRVINIDIQINIGGIRAYNISRTQPFVIGIYCDNNKPNDAQQLMSDAVTELTDVLVNGVSRVYHIHTIRLHLKHYIRGPKPPAVQLYRRLAERVELDAVEGGIFLDDVGLPLRPSATCGCHSTRKGPYGDRSANIMFINTITMVAVERNSCRLILQTNRNLGGKVAPQEAGDVQLYLSNTLTRTLAPRLAVLLNWRGINEKGAFGSTWLAQGLSYATTEKFLNTNLLQVKAPYRGGFATADTRWTKDDPAEYYDSDVHTSTKERQLQPNKPHTIRQIRRLLAGFKVQSSAKTSLMGAPPKELLGAATQLSGPHRDIFPIKPHQNAQETKQTQARPNSLNNSMSGRPKGDIERATSGIGRNFCPRGKTLSAKGEGPAQTGLSLAENNPANEKQPSKPSSEEADKYASVAPSEPSAQTRNTAIKSANLCGYTTLGSSPSETAETVLKCLSTNCLSLFRNAHLP
ncbi:hypothetical protein CLF_106721, partial [Clonorchis sinensis]